MSHEAHNDEHHEGPEIDIAKSRSAFSASFWFMLILACVFIAALNFVNVMGQPEEGHGGHEGNHSEAPAHGAAPAGHGEATHEAHDGAEMEGGHADAVHEPTSTNDQEGDDAADGRSETH